MGLAAALLLGGCHHQDAVDSTFDWIHHMRGGAIAEQRPPPPGRYDPYPLVGLTPTTPPALPSAQARTLLTQQLIRNRTLTYRTVSANGTLYPDIPPPPNAAATGAAAGKPQPAGTAQKGENGQPAPATLPPGVNGAIMDAAEAPPPPPVVAGTSAASPAQAGSSQAGSSQGGTQQGGAGQAELPMPAVTHAGTGNTKGSATQDEAEVAMPEVRQKADQGNAPPVAIPQIPDAPPEPPAFPGYDVPSDAGLADSMQPNYDLTNVRGTPFHFVPQSDLLSAGQDGTFTKLLSSTPHGPFYIRGFGDTASQDVQDQADAVRLGLLRATRIAQGLVSRGVPASAIHVRGDAFGTGAMVSTTP
ncbi:hypothetical protein K2X14_11160 [Acetobacter sp. TBRC 12305]|uniref:OmpA-like domain-containing protein n=2 Tax=Acetobacter garciniae TaxID=2817435 RepID=A0A939HPK4_9PROT|nr:hypothetical protein [Acetobacter garciniae]MBX0345396.1 hypothetical protein [Acetobacter garciniae]